MQARGSTPGLECRSWKSRAGGASGQRLERRRSPGRRAYTRPLAKRCACGVPPVTRRPWAAHGHCQAIWLLASLLPPVAMVSPAQGSPPGPQMLGLISLSASGSGDELSEQGWGTSEARSGHLDGTVPGIPVWQVPSWVLEPGDRRERALLSSGKRCGWRKGLCGKRRES